MASLATESANIGEAFTSDNLLDALDQANAQLSSDWIGKIFFEFKPIFLSSSTIKDKYYELTYALQSTEYIFDDICKYVNNCVHTRLYFNVSKYHYQPETVYVKPSPFLSKAFLDLRTDLETASFDCWSPVIGNGGKSNYKSFTCQACHRNRLKHQEAILLKNESNLKFRSESLIS